MRLNSRSRFFYALPAFRRDGFDGMNWHPRTSFYAINWPDTLRFPSRGNYTLHSRHFDMTLGRIRRECDDMMMNRPRRTSRVARTQVRRTPLWRRGSFVEVAQHARASLACARQRDLIPSRLTFTISLSAVKYSAFTAMNENSSTNFPHGLSWIWREWRTRVPGIKCPIAVHFSEELQVAVFWRLHKDT